MSPSRESTHIHVNVGDPIGRLDRARVASNAFTAAAEAVEAMAEEWRTSTRDMLDLNDRLTRWMDYQQDRFAMGLPFDPCGPDALGSTKAPPETATATLESTPSHILLNDSGATVVRLDAVSMVSKPRDSLNEGRYQMNLFIGPLPSFGIYYPNKQTALDDYARLARALCGEAT